MPNVFIYATPEAYVQLESRLKDVSDVFAHRLAPRLLRPPSDIALRLIKVEAMEHVPDVHIEVKALHLLSPENQQRMQRECNGAVITAWLELVAKKPFEGVHDVDCVTEVSEGTWTKFWSGGRG